MHDLSLVHWNIVQHISYVLALRPTYILSYAELFIPYFVSIVASVTEQIPINPTIPAIPCHDHLFTVGFPSHPRHAAYTLYSAHLSTRRLVIF